VPRLLHEETGLIVRDLIEGPSLLELLTSREGRLPEPIFHALRHTLSWAAGQGDVGASLDLSPANLMWDRARRRVMLADVGPAARASRLLVASTDALRAALASYGLTTASPSSSRLKPALVPPSGRFHRVVRAAAFPDARPLWVNERILSALGLAHGHAVVRWLDGTVGRSPAFREQAVLPGGRRLVGTVVLRSMVLAWVVLSRSTLPLARRRAAVRDELARLGFATDQTLALLADETSLLELTVSRCPWRMLRDWPDADLLGGWVARAAAADGIERWRLQLLTHSRGWTQTAEDCCAAQLLGVEGLLAEGESLNVDGSFSPDRAVRFSPAPRVDPGLMCSVIDSVRSLGMAMPGKGELTAAAWRGVEEGLARYLGPAFRQVDPRQRREVAQAALNLLGQRDSRGRPAYALGRQTQYFVNRCARNRPRPHQALALAPAADERAGERFSQAVKAAMGRARAPFVGREWRQLLRPFVADGELERHCERERPTAWAEWMAAGRHLPEGTYDYWQARAWAGRLRHVALPGLRPHRYERVVGLTPELAAWLRRTVRRVLGPRLLGVLLVGSRVMVRQRLAQLAPDGVKATGMEVHQVLRELGPLPEVSSDLDLRVFVRGVVPGSAQHIRLERALARALRRAPAWFPLLPANAERHRLTVSTAKSLRRAFRRYNVSAWRRVFGRRPLPEEQVVMLLDEEGELPNDAVRPVLARLPVVPAQPRLIPLGKVKADRAMRPFGLSLHQLTCCLLDDPLAQPRVNVDHRGRARMAPDALRAMRDAGRAWVAVQGIVFDPSLERGLSPAELKAMTTRK
jgi:hypothetical protein